LAPTGPLATQSAPPCGASQTHALRAWSISYVVPVLQFKKERVDLGSGVLVNNSGHHFVATARHCIDADVRVIRSTNPLHHVGSTSSRPLNILNRGWHDTLDLGYLEIEDPECAELGWGQLSNDRIVSGMAQFVGYPEELVERIHTLPGKLTDVSLAAGTFGTTLTEETDDRMTFNFPAIGAKYDHVTGTWCDSPFPKTPRGFSGGACFGVAKPPGPIAHVQYRLLAIQHAWNERNRCVFAVPIKRWCELLIAHGLV
ncbi:MAG: trypsin-like peptidase domain-containing protein, partial [Phycisphaerae bacterium]|nr:trypsin-like peptidase domain-containing protein [Phycisphaerae bacterium]